MVPAPATAPPMNPAPAPRANALEPPDPKILDDECVYPVGP